MLKRFFIFMAASYFIFAAAIAFANEPNIVKINQDIEIKKDMAAGEVVAIRGDVIVSGRVENNVVAIGGSVILNPKSYVGGEVVVIGGELDRDPSATVRGKITQVYVPKFIPSAASLLKGGWLVLWATVSLLALLGFLGLAILLVALIPENMGASVNALEQSFAKMLAFGLLWTILVLPIAALLAISIVGIILIPLELLLVALALILGYIASAIFIGKNVILSFKKVSPPFVDAVLGILILFLIGFVPIVGQIIKALFLIAGFGAVLTTRFGTAK